MTKVQMVVLTILIAIVAFAATFIPSLAIGLRDEDDVAPKRTPPSQTIATSKQSVPVDATSTRRRGVDRDCYEDGTVCSKARLADAEALDELIGPTISRAGWQEGCYEVRYIAGDNGERDAISINVVGRTNLGPDRCQEQLAGGATRSQLVPLANTIKKIVVGNAKLSQNVDTLQVTDGADVDVQLPIP